jgi:LPS sulfotransferase NodH
VGRETVAAIRAVLAFAEGWLSTLQEQPGAYRSTSRSSVVSEAKSSQQMPGTRQIISGSTSESSLLGPLRLVEEIDALVQERVRERPDLADQGIRLTHDIDGRILIYVGQQRYRSADDIPDDDVKALIHDAIRVWESQ